jgi:hypothetical protein
LALPAHVLKAVFSTLFKLKSVFTSENDLPSKPLAVNLAYSLSAALASSTFNAFVLAMPKVKASCFAFHVAALDIYESVIAVPFQTPVVIVPNVVIFELPAHVDKAVFSTLSKLKSVFTSAKDLDILYLQQKRYQLKLNYH